MQHLNILYFLTTIFIGIFSISIISVIAIKTKKKALWVFLFFFSSFTLLIVENTLYLYIEANLHNISFGFFVFLNYLVYFSMSLLMFTIAYSAHFIYNVNHAGYKNIIFGILSFIGLLISIISTKIYPVSKSIIDYSYIKVTGLTVQKILLILTIVYYIVTGIINFIKNKCCIKNDLFKNILILTVVFLPSAVIDNIYPRLTQITFYPISYCISGIMCAYFILKEHFSSQFQDNHNIPNDDYYKKYDISQREKEVILLIMEGYSNKQICDKLFISLSTVKTHIANIFEKLNVKSRFELITLIKRSTQN